MALNYLAALGLQPEQGPVGGPRPLPQRIQSIDPNGPFENGLATPGDAPEQRPSMAPPQRGRGGGFVNTLGGIADVLALIGGSQPLYGPLREQERQRRQADEGRAALAHWLANPDDPAALRRAMMADPDRVLGIRKDMEGEQYTLGENQVRYQGGREIARGPEGSPEVTVIDGIAYDTRTGEPQFESPYPRIIAGTEGEFLQQPRRGLGRRPGGAQPGTVAPQTATNPQTGERLQLNPQTNQWEPIGMTNAQGGAALSSASRTQSITPEDAARVRQSLGPNGRAAYENWLSRNNIAIGGQ